VGLLASLALFIGASTAGHTRLMALAALAAFATYRDFRRIEFVRETGPARAPESPRDAPVGPASPPPEPAAEPSLDALLAKISASGLASLTAEERQVLARETERRRRAGGASEAPRGRAP
jgi:hypothetical protein